MKEQLAPTIHSIQPLALQMNNMNWGKKKKKFFCVIFESLSDFFSFTELIQT